MTLLRRAKKKCNLCGEIPLGRTLTGYEESVPKCRDCQAPLLALFPDPEEG